MSRKDEMVCELNYLCSRDSIISKRTTEEILKLISWKWTENRDLDGLSSEEVGNGYYGCTYWSRKALEAVYEDFPDLKKRKKISDAQLRKFIVTHEHVIPKRLFVNYVMKCIDDRKPITFDKESIDSTMLIGCIVTKDEAKILDSKELGIQRNMPPNIISTFPIAVDEVWSRYQLVNNNVNDEDKITVYKVTWKEDGRNILEIKNINI